jgi:hypothetical protein
MYKFRQSNIYKAQSINLWQAGFYRSAIRHWISKRLIQLCEFLDKKVW